MKKFFVIAVFSFVVMLSTTALAANWVEVCSVPAQYGHPITTWFVDKDSIKHGMKTTCSDFSPPGSFSAIVKSKDELCTRVFLIGYWTAEGKRYLAFLGYDEEKGEGLIETPFDEEFVTTAEDFQSKLYDYIEENLP